MLHGFRVWCYRPKLFPFSIQEMEKNSPESVIYEAKVTMSLVYCKVLSDRHSTKKTHVLKAYICKVFYSFCEFICEFNLFSSRMSLVFVFTV